MKTIIFPSSYFSDFRVDEELRAEYDAAADTGLFDTVLFSNEKWFGEGKLKLSKAFDEPISAVYRGWMMNPLQYNDFYNELKDQNIELITTPKQYELFHIFPNIYPMLRDDTAGMIVYSDISDIRLDEIRQSFDKFMVKDHVKSVKGTSFPKYFESSISQDEFNKYMEKFRELRGSLFTGGICIKEYLDLKLYGDRTNEYRVFYIGGQTAAVSRNSGQKSYAPTPPRELIEKYAGLGSPYYTIDYAELESGEWKALETGDGQVSGLSDFQDHQAYFRALYHCLN